ncbi:MAG TPA: protein kinase [Vicinamibacterales bacterium]
MALAIGTRIGSYEIIGALGAGGMGEVYRARDLKLPRDVALKVLPDAFANDPDRLARFEREAQLLATLNHPHIASIYGVEDSTDVRALVLELVAGETLADKLALASGPSAPGLPIEEAVAIAIQIAEALEAAHNEGVIHRDLKPGNIKVKPDGTVKVLDFGLAKLNAPSMSPAMGSTITAPPMHTEVGTILGTPAYMAPEQTRGMAADRRGDIWAFGCILYEMLTGRRLFDGEHTSDTIALVLTKDPDWTAVPARVPPAIRTLLRRCLERDPRNRVADASTLRFVLEEASGLSIAARQTSSTDRVAPARPANWTLAMGLAAATLGVAAVAAATYAWTRPRPIAPRVVRTAIPLSNAASITVSAFRDLYSPTPDVALTPDGSRIVYVGNNGTQLFVRSLDALEPVVIAEGLQLRNPFVSPDGQWVGYAEKRFVLRKVPISGGPSIPLATRLDTDFAGGTWLPDDTIIFSTFGTRVGLRLTTAAAGTPSAEPESLTRPNQGQGEDRHLWPDTLPGGQAILFTITSSTGGDDAAQVAVFDRRSKTQKILVRGGSNARYLASPSSGSDASGYLVYHARGALRAIPFDVSALETRGTAVAIVPRLVTMLNAGADFALASNGTLVYVQPEEGLTRANTTLAWIDRSGHELPAKLPPHLYGWVRVSPDGSRLALGGGGGEAAREIWVWDTKAATLTPIHLPPGGGGNGPIWMPNGQRITYQGIVPGEPPNIWWSPADGSGVAERLTTTKTNPQRPTGVSPDGLHLLFMEAAPSLDVLQLTLDRNRTVTPLVATPAWDASALVSPNQHWIAYESDVSGQMHVYVSPYPAVATNRVQVSVEGGSAPRWSADGKALFFVDPNGALMHVSVEASEQVWRSSTPIKHTQLLDSLGGIWYGAYDVAPDGRIVVIKNAAVDAGAPKSQIVVVQHFDAELAAKRAN